MGKVAYFSVNMQIHVSKLYVSLLKWLEVPSIPDVA